MLIFHLLHKCVILFHRNPETKYSAQQLQQQVTDMTQSNAELEYKIEHSEDADTIEEIARDKLGLVKPGEKIFYDMSN